MAGTYLSFIDISYDVLLEAYVDIMVHAFFMWIGLYIGRCTWLAYWWMHMVGILVDAHVGIWWIHSMDDIFLAHC